MNDFVITVRVIWGLNWRVRLVNLLYLIYVEIEHANFQPSQVRMNRIQTILVLIELDIGMVEVLKLRRFSFFLNIDYLYVHVDLSEICKMWLPFSPFHINASKTVFSFSKSSWWRLRFSFYFPKMGQTSYELW